MEKELRLIKQWTEEIKDMVCKKEREFIDVDAIVMRCDAIQADVGELEYRIVQEEPDGYQAALMGLMGPFNGLQVEALRKVFEVLTD